MSTFESVHDPLRPREVLLGRTTHVQRLLPHKERRMIGAWCFLDHFGPDDIKRSGGMWVPPHPHTGLQTVTWLFDGLGLHLDSLGSHQLIRPGQLNVMTAGHGVAHAEVSPPEAPRYMHGVQLWACLPEASRDTAPAGFAHLAELPTWTEYGVTLRVVTGTVAGLTSPAPAYTPLVAAEVTLAPGASATLPLEPDFEHGVLVATGTADVAGVELGSSELSYLGTGLAELRLAAAEDQPDDTVLLLLGGEPFAEEIVMWWNFVARSHDEIVEMREAWNGSGLEHEPERFGVVREFRGDRLLAPPLPNTRLKPRGRSA